MKTRSVPSLTSVVLFACLAIGCSADCVSLCEDQKECEGADKDKDCADECKETEALVEKASCEDQYDELLNCEASQDDICRSDENACGSETNAYSECVTKYCSQQLRDESAPCG